MATSALHSCLAVVSIGWAAASLAAPGRIYPAQKYQPNEEHGGPLSHLQGAINGIHYSRATEEASEASFSAWRGPNAPEDAGIWHVTCDVDPIHDSRFCQVRRPWSSLIVSFGPNCQPLVVVVGTEHYPGTESLLRIDGGKPHITKNPEGVFPRAIYAQVVKQLRDGKPFITRYTRWPYKNEFHDQESTAVGFAEAADYACWAVKRVVK